MKIAIFVKGIPREDEEGGIARFDRWNDEKLEIMRRVVKREGYSIVLSSVDRCAENPESLE